MVFIGTNGLRPAVGGGNNDNFFHGESRVIRYDDHDKDDYEIMVMMMMLTTMTTMTMTNSGHQSKMHRELTMSTHVETSG